MSAVTDRLAAREGTASGTRALRPGRRLVGLALLVPSLGLAACVTPAEYEKLRIRVVKLERGEAGGAGPARERMAELAAEVQRLARENERLAGRVEVSEHRAEEALREARAARAQEAMGSTPVTPPAEEPPEPPEAAGAAELKSYRAARAAWKSGDVAGCIDRFRNFLQTYPDSAYADDASYWMADCYFKNGDFKTAVLRFDDVAARYPTGNKAADALYRQGEALMRLGPNYGRAAQKAFERVLKEYPDSARIPEARRHLEVLKAG